MTKCPSPLWLVHRNVSILYFNVLFRSIKKKILHLLKSRLFAIGVAPSNSSGHSFRRGGASFAFALRIPSELIQQQGDWRSDAYLRYLGKPLSQRLKVAFAFKNALQS